MSKNSLSKLTSSLSFIIKLISLFPLVDFPDAVGFFVFRVVLNDEQHLIYILSDLKLQVHQQLRDVYPLTHLDYDLSEGQVLVQSADLGTQVFGLENFLSVVQLELLFLFHDQVFYFDVIQLMVGSIVQLHFVEPHLLVLEQQLLEKDLGVLVL